MNKTGLACDVDHILIDADQLQARIRQLGAQITEYYRGEEVLLLGVLKGAVPFYAALSLCIELPVQCDFLAVSSYGHSTGTSGEVRLTKDLDGSIEGRHVLIVEDILDTGLTLRYLTEILRSRNPKSLKLCTLLDKPSRRRTPIQSDFTGFTVPDEFVVGYGLDYAELYRNLPYIGVLKKEIYSK